MISLKLRPHHISFFVDIYNESPFSESTIKAYTKETLERMKEIVLNVTPTTNFEIIDGMDDFCYVCKHLEICKEKEYEKHPLFTPSINDILRGLPPNPDEADQLALYRNNVRIGDILKLEEILQLI